MSHILAVSEGPHSGQGGRDVEPGLWAQMIMQPLPYGEGGRLSYFDGMNAKNWRGDASSLRRSLGGPAGYVGFRSHPPIAENRRKSRAPF